MLLNSATRSITFGAIGGSCRCTNVLRCSCGYQQAGLAFPSSFPFRSCCCSQLLVCVPTIHQLHYVRHFFNVFRQAPDPNAVPTAEAEAHWRAILARLCRLPRITSWKSPRALSAQAPDPNAVPTAEDEAYRRAILARSRNYLLFEALRDEGWVLWLDVDIVAVCSNCNSCNVLYSLSKWNILHGPTAARHELGTVAGVRHCGGAILNLEQ